MADNYKVVSVQAGCCGNVSTAAIERICDKMSKQGFDLVVAYEAMTGCCCQNKAAVLVFRR